MTETMTSKSEMPIGNKLGISEIADIERYIEHIEDWAALPEEPLVSVCITTYNHEAFISEAVEGALKQETSFPFEIIINDDCSTDGTAEIITEYQREYPGLIRLRLAEKNLYSINRRLPGIGTRSSARGKYIALCEGDDYWTDPRKLQKQFDYLEAHPETVVSYHDSFLISKEGAPVDSADIKKEHKRDYSRDELKLGAHMATASMCYRNVISHFPPEYFHVLNGDAFLTSMLGQYGSGKFHHDIKASAYRIHTGGIHSSGEYAANKEASAHTRYLLASYYRRIGDHDSFEKLLKNYKERLAYLLNFYARHAGIKGIIVTYWRLRTRCYKVMDPSEIASISSFSFASLIEAIRSKVKS